MADINKQIESCILMTDNFIKRAKKFYTEWEKRGQLSDDEKANETFGTIEGTMTEKELDNYNSFCISILKQAYPNYSTLVDQWNDTRIRTHKNWTYGIHYRDLEAEFVSKKQILEQALFLNNKPNIVTFTDSKLIIPEGYNKLQEPLQRFANDTRNKCNEYDRNVFIMTRFAKNNKAIASIDMIIRETLSSFGLIGHRADDFCYPIDRNLWDNVATYMIGCKYGIAVLEDIIHEEFNPNVALEYGFMRALNKPTLLLKESRFKPRADILGTIWEEFDILTLDSIEESLKTWIRNIQ